MHWQVTLINEFAVGMALLRATEVPSQLLRCSASERRRYNPSISDGAIADGHLLAQLVDSRRFCGAENTHHVEFRFTAQEASNLIGRRARCTS